jgi:hypothetical protein
LHHGNTTETPRMRNSNERQKLGLESHVVNIAPQTCDPLRAYCTFGALCSSGLMKSPLTHVYDTECRQFDCRSMVEALSRNLMIDVSILCPILPRSRFGGQRVPCIIVAIKEEVSQDIAQSLPPNDSSLACLALLFPNRVQRPN